MASSVGPDLGMWWKICLAIFGAAALAALALPLATLRIQVDLPPAAPAAKPACPTIALSIAEIGGRTSWLLNGVQTTAQSLLLDMSKQRKCAPESTPVVIRANRRVQYRQFMALVDELQRGGYTKINLITEGASN